MITRCLLQRTDVILAKHYVDCGRDRIVAFDPELFDLATRAGMRCELLTERPPYSEFAYAVAAAKARAASLDHQIASTIAKITGLQSTLFYKWGYYDLASNLVQQISFETYAAISEKITEIKLFWYGRPALYNLDSGLPAYYFSKRHPSCELIPANAVNTLIEQYEDPQFTINQALRPEITVLALTPGVGASQIEGRDNFIPSTNIHLIHSPAYQWISTPATPLVSVQQSIARYLKLTNYFTELDSMTQRLGEAIRSRLDASLPEQPEFQREFLTLLLINKTLNFGMMLNMFRNKTFKQVIVSDLEGGLSAPLLSAAKHLDSQSVKFVKHSSYALDHFGVHDLNFLTSSTSKVWTCHSAERSVALRAINSDVEFKRKQAELSYALEQDTLKRIGIIINGIYGANLGLIYLTELLDFVKTVTALVRKYGKSLYIRPKYGNFSHLTFQSKGFDCSLLASETENISDFITSCDVLIMPSTGDISSAVLHVKRHRKPIIVTGEEYNYFGLTESKGLLDTIGETLFSYKECIQLLSGLLYDIRDQRK